MNDRSTEPKRDKGEIPTGEKLSIGQTGQSARGSGDTCPTSLVRWANLMVFATLICHLCDHAFTYYNVGGWEKKHDIECHFASLGRCSTERNLPAMSAHFIEALCSRPPRSASPLPARRADSSSSLSQTTAVLTIKSDHLHFCSLRFPLPIFGEFH